MEAYILTVDNIHCQSCKDSIIKVLAPLVPEPTQDYVLVDIPEGTITVAVQQRNELLKEKIVSALYDAGFDVLLVDAQSLEQQSSNPFMNWIWGKKRHHKHKEHCTSCQKSKKLFRKSTSHNSGSESDGGSSDETLQGVKVVSPDDQPMLFRAVFSIGGMTCAACQNSITAAVQENLPEVSEFAVDLMTKSGMAVVSDKRLVNKIQEAVTEVGYDCEVVEVIPLGSGGNSDEDKFKVVASIGGMTCASCVNAVLAQVQQLPFVHESNVDLLGHSGVFVITEPKVNVPKLKEAVEDAGYEFEVVSVNPTLAVKSKSRTVNLSVTGMFCG